MGVPVTNRVRELTNAFREQRRSHFLEEWGGSGSDKPKVKAEPAARFMSIAILALQYAFQTHNYYHFVAGLPLVLRALDVRSALTAADVYGVPILTNAVHSLSLCEF